MANENTASKSKNVDGTYDSSGGGWFAISPAQTIEWEANYQDSDGAGDAFVIHREGQSLYDIVLSENLSWGYNRGTHHLNTGNYEISITHFSMGAGSYLIRYNRVASINVTTSNPNFGTFIEGEESSPKTFTIQSTGDVDVTISSVTSNNNHFEVILGGVIGQTVPSNKTFQVKCIAGNVSGSFNGIITVEGNSELGSCSDTINVSCTVEPKTAGVEVSTVNTNFGTLLEGDTSAPKTFTISSTGNQPITITGIDSSDNAHFELTLGGIIGQVVPPNRTFSVTCKAGNVPGYFNATITVRVSSGIGDRSDVITVSCTVQAREPNITCPSTQDLGSADWYTGEQKVFRPYFENQGTANLIITSINIANDTTPNVFRLEGDPVISPLAPDQRREVAIRFVPPFDQGEMVYYGHLIIQSDDPDENIKNCPFFATAHHPVPIMELEEVLLDYKDLELGFSFTKAITVFNRGDANLDVNITKLAPSNSDYDHYVVDDGNQSLPPGLNALTFRQTYRPQDIGGPHTVQLRVSGNDLNNPYQDVTLTGKAIAPIPIDSVLVLDRSGSMARAAGNRQKIEALRTAADLFVHALAQRDIGDKIGFVRYNDENDIYLNLDEINDPSNPNTHLTDAENRLADNEIYTPGGGLYPKEMTCIGGAMQTAAGMIVNSPSDRKHIMVVLSDGKENVGPYIHEVIGPIRDNDQILKMYSVGLGQEYDPEKLQLITNIGNGYHQVTDELSGLSIFDLEAFYFKIFSNATEMDLVTDPTYLVHIVDNEPVIVGRIPIISSDRSVTFLVLQNPDLQNFYDLELIDPNGHVIHPGSSIGGISVKILKRYNYTLYRAVFPLVEQTTLFVGEWILRLTPKFDKPNKKFLSSRMAYLKKYVKPSSLYIPIGLLASVKSNYRLKVNLLSSNFIPGTQLRLEAALFDCGWPVNNGNVDVDITTPNGIKYSGLKMYDDGTHGDIIAGDAIWTTKFPHTDENGTYRVLFRTRGKNRTGEATTREASRYITLSHPKEQVPISKPCIPCRLQKLLWILVLLLLVLLFLKQFY